MYINILPFVHRKILWPAQIHNLHGSTELTLKKWRERNEWQTYHLKIKTKIRIQDIKTMLYGEEGIVNGNEKKYWNPIFFRVKHIRGSCVRSQDHICLMDKSLVNNSSLWQCRCSSYIFHFIGKIVFSRQRLSYCIYVVSSNSIIRR